MDVASLVGRILEESHELANTRYIFRLAAVEEQFYLLHPWDNFGTCWQYVDRLVREYPGVFSAGDAEEALEGLELARDADGDFVIPDIENQQARMKIRRCLESLAGRMRFDGNRHVVPQP
jgi:hypothetical protein